MVKPFLAYAFLVIGVPNYMGLILGALLMPLAWPFPILSRRLVIQFLEFPRGLISMVFARGLFYLLHVPAHWAILVISIGWITFYFYSYRKSKTGWASFTLGLVAGWFISPI